MSKNALFSLKNRKNRQIS